MRNVVRGSWNRGKTMSDEKMILIEKREAARQDFNRISSLVDSLNEQREAISCRIEFYDMKIDELEEEEDEDE